MKRFVSLIAIAVLTSVALAQPLLASSELGELTEGQRIADFTVHNLYVNEFDKPVGAQFRHVQSGFVLDILRIQSIPQAFLWVNTPVNSGKGEPHALEHMVSGKGTKAQWMSSFEAMSLSTRSAGTGQTITCYDFHTLGGKDVFFKLIEVKLDAFLHPNFTDEEMRREIYTIGYTIDPADSSITLEETGTINAEMTAGYESGWGWVAELVAELEYGPNHPMSSSSGGDPREAREASVEDYRKYHAEHYHLNNMGMILCMGDDIGLEECLTRTSEIFARVEPDARPAGDPTKTEDNFPAPKSAPMGTIGVVEFPSRDENESSVMFVSWGPNLEYVFNESLLREYFMLNLAEGEGSILYKRLIDPQTRLLDIGATDVWGGYDPGQGCLFYVILENVSQDNVNEKMMDSVRSLVLAEIEAITEYADGAEELKEFNTRVWSSLAESRRRARTALNEPPGFGYRYASSYMVPLLMELNQMEGFRKDLFASERIKFVEDLLNSGRNFWKDYIAKWRLLENKPYVVAGRPSPEMVSQGETERQQRLDQFVENLKKEYNVRSRDVALKRFVADYDARTKEIEAASASVEMPGFIDNPPLSSDPLLDYRVEKLPGGRDNVVSTFDYITSAEIGLYLNMNVVPESLLVYVAALPTLLTDVGVMKDDVPIAYDKVTEMIRGEILKLQAGFDVNYANGRVELKIVAGGSTPEESEKAMGWLTTVIYDADWREENLPRMRDAVDNALSRERHSMDNWEEFWIDNPADAYWKQANPLLLSTDCFLTKQHSLMRVKWMLKEEGTPETGGEFGDFMVKLAEYATNASRSQLLALGSRLTSGATTEGDVKVDASLVDAFEKLSDPASGLVKEAVSDLLQSLVGIPDGSLSDDWQYLCRCMTKDVATAPSAVLDNLIYILELLRAQDNVRAYMVGNRTNLNNLIPLLNELVEQFSDEPSLRQTYSDKPVVMSRVRERSSADVKLVYVGLINENTRSGVFVNSAPCAGFDNWDSEKLLDYLADRMYGGKGGHSMYLKTWAAGLAYTNGLRANENAGRINYLAICCPSLVQTMQFVVNELKSARPVSGLTEYAVAQAFGSGRAGASYEDRASAMAADLADGLTPEKITGFRKAVLDLRKDPDLHEKLTSRMPDVCGRILPGLGPKGSEVEDAVYFVIGPETQFEAFEDYLKKVEGEDAMLYRLYPRDYWITGGYVK